MGDDLLEMERANAVEMGRLFALRCERVQSAFQSRFPDWEVTVGRCPSGGDMAVYFYKVPKGRGNESMIDASVEEIENDKTIVGDYLLISFIHAESMDEYRAKYHALD